MKERDEMLKEMRAADGSEFAAARRPWLDAKGRSWVTVQAGGVVGDVRLPSKKPSKVKAVLTKEQWYEVDRRTARAYALRTPVTTSIAAACSFGGFDGMSKMMLEHERVVDDGENVERVTSETALPLPITHDDFDVDPLDLEKSLINAEASARRVGDAVEQTVLMGSLKTGVFGLCNFPPRLKLNLSGRDLKKSVGVMLAMAGESSCFGPFVLAYSSEGGLNGMDTRMNREGKEILRMEGLAAMFPTPWMPEGEMVLVQVSGDCCRIVRGLDPTVMQWEGGKFKLATITVPQMFADVSGRAGIVHATMKAGRTT